MTTFAIALVKDEADIVEQTVSWMRTQVDHVLIADNMSADGTREILEGLPVELLDDTDPAHHQARKMTALAARAAAAGADYVVPFDADELVYSPFGRVADVIEDRGAVVYPVGLYDHRPTSSDPDDADPLKRLGWRHRKGSGLHKIAARAALPVRLSEGSHQASYPDPEIAWDLLILRHYAYRSAEQFVRKIRNGYAGRKATNPAPDQSVHLMTWGALLEAEGEEALARVFHDEFFVTDPEQAPSLIFDPVSACMSSA